MSLKPIEPGCLAVVIGSLWEPNNGKVVRVGRFIGPLLQAIGEDYWETDLPIGFVSPRGSFTFYENAIRQIRLLRIDGDSFEHEEGEHDKHRPEETPTPIFARPYTYYDHTW